MRWFLVLMIGCTPQPDTGAVPTCDDGAPRVIATTTDYSVGALATLDPASGRVDDMLASVGGDPVLFSLDDEVVVVERSSSDVLRFYAPGCWQQVVLEVGLRTGVNAHSVAAVGETLVVTHYEEDQIGRYERQTAEELPGIDLSQYGDADGLPEADALVTVDGRLFAGLQRLDRTGGWTSDVGMVVELDAHNGTVLGAWEVGPNPKLFAHGDVLLVLVGSYFEPDGGAWLLDPVTGALELVLDETELGFDLGGYAESDGVGVFTGTDFDVDGPARFLCLDWDSRVVAQGPTSTHWYASAVAGRLGEVWLAARPGWGASGGLGGLVRVDVNTCASEPPIELTLPPYSLIFR